MAVKTGVITSLELGAGNQRGQAIARWACPDGNVSVTCLRDKGSSKLSTVSWPLSDCVKEWQIRWWYQLLTIGSDGSYVQRWVAGDWQTLSRWSNTATFSIPEGATSIWFDLWMGPDTYYYYPSASADQPANADCFEPQTVSREVFTGAFEAPQVPSITAVEMAPDGITAKVTVSDEDPYTKLFQVQGNNGAVSASSSTKSDSHTYKNQANVPLRCAPGQSYSIRARMQNVLGCWSQWATWPDPVKTRPAKVPSAAASALSDGSASVTWGGAAGAEKYEIAYANSPSAFSLSSGYKIKTTEGAMNPLATAYAFDDLEAGVPWYFWVRAVNASGNGDWSPASNEVVLGSAPAAPTVWADAYAAVRGEPVRIGWQHNSTDGTAQTKARVRYRSGNSGDWAEIAIDGIASSAEIPTGSVEDGGSLNFYVNTWGAASGDGLVSPNSEVRGVRVWDRPSVEIDAPDEVSSYPVPIRVSTAAGAQTAMSVSLSVIADRPHEIQGIDGEPRAVAAGELVWGCLVQAPADPLLVELTPWDAVLGNGQTYTVEAKCVMSSGLDCEASCSMKVAVEPGAMDIQASISRSGEWGVEVAASAFVPPQVEIRPGRTLVTEPVWADAVLSIYRHETDGSMTPLMVGIPNDGTYSLVDSHARLRRQAYRVVAVDGETGAIEYADVTSDILGGGLVVVEWGGGNAVMYRAAGDAASPNSGDGGAPSAIALPWNIELTEENDRDVTHIGYSGRAHPLSYSGTQLGQTATYSCAIDKEDDEAVAALRSLAAWMGEAYVREPLGNGFWATVRPSLSADSESPLVQVTMDVVRTDTADGCIDMGGGADDRLARVDGPELRVLRG